MNYWQGEKVLLRAVEPSDGVHFQRWNMVSERGRQLDYLWPPTSAASMEKWAAAASDAKMVNDSFRWVIENRAGEPVGQIDTHHCDLRNGTFSYGVDVAPEHQRQGYAAAAIGMVIRYYFDHLRYQKVWVQIHSSNSASIALHRQLGFTHEGTQRRMVYTNGGYEDLLYYGLLREEEGIG